MDYLNRFLGSRTVINSRTWGTLIVEAASFTPATDGDLVVFFGGPFTHDNPLVRIHSECVFSEVFDSDFCDCADQLKLALQRLKEEGEGILFYLRFDGRGAGLAAKVKATSLEMQGMDTYESRVKIGVPPEGRSFVKIGEYLREHGISRVRLLTNNPVKIADLEKAGVQVTPIQLYVPDPNEHVCNLYRTKVQKFNHKIPLKIIKNW